MVAQNDKKEWLTLTRRAFLEQTAAGLLVVGAGVVGAGPGLHVLLPVTPSRVRFGQDRAFVGDRITLLAELNELEPQRVEFRIASPAGFCQQLQVEALRGRGILEWRVPRTAVPLRPGICPLRLEARIDEGHWTPAEAPLEVLINRFAFGL